MPYLNEKDEDAPAVPTLTDSPFPALLDDTDFKLQVPEDLTETADIQVCKRADVGVANTLLKVCYVALTKATSVSSLCHAINQTIKATEHRRKVLLVPYGAEGNGSKSKIFDPLD